MINLIPIKDRKEATKDFYFRFFTLFFVALSFSVLIASIVLLPSYFFSLVKKSSANTKLEMQKKEPVPLLDQETLLIIENLKNKLNLIEKAELDKFYVSQKVISEILFKKMPDIKINSISYEKDPKENKLIKINGLAPNRERLLLFRQILEEDSAFSKVNLPISNFVKGSNIEFYLELTSL
jgi:hypothetical protein